jgi:Xaa-Pro aminopeptidase
MDIVEAARPGYAGQRGIDQLKKETTMRLTQLRTALIELGLDAMLVSQPENRRYLSGFTGSAGHLLISAERSLLATDFRYYEQVEREAPLFELIKLQDSLEKTLPKLLSDADVHRLGFESQYVTVDQLYTWSQATQGVEWVPLKNIVEDIRSVKDPEEIELLRRSVAVTDEAYAHLLQVLRPGMTEREAAWVIEEHMRTHCASKVSFDLIVASGPNGALPHARPGDRPIGLGEPIVIDIGCIVDGYCSDMTRTICLGQPDSRYLEVWNIVLKAQQAGEAAIRAGMTGVQADATARDVIVSAGYGEHFGHGLGHGVGLAVHEAPRASRLSEDMLRANMSLTIEPGIYLPGLFGVRIEDLVIVHEEGVEILTKASKLPALSE